MWKATDKGADAEKDSGAGEAYQFACKKKKKKCCHRTSLGPYLLQLFSLSLCLLVVTSLFLSLVFPSLDGLQTAEGKEVEIKAEKQINGLNGGQRRRERKKRQSWDRRFLVLGQIIHFVPFALALKIYFA